MVSVTLCVIVLVTIFSMSLIMPTGLAVAFAMRVSMVSVPHMQHFGFIESMLLASDRS